jgi:hypothetical protein
MTCSVCCQSAVVRTLALEVVSARPEADGKPLLSLLTDRNCFSLKCDNDVIPGRFSVDCARVFLRDYCLMEFLST